jgi:hypothetical protein
VCGCSSSASNGNSGSSGTSASNKQTLPEYERVDADADNDITAPYDDKNNHEALNFGHEAGEPDKRVITALVKRYYTLALAGDAAKACATIYSTLAESVPEDYGSAPAGPPYMRGTTCPAVLHGLFNHTHQQLAVEVPLLHVMRVRMLEHHVKVILSFGRLPEREIYVGREGHTWRIGSLLDRELP